jgi:CubicO group peptidase (beta-lactamase class C family)
MRLRLAQVATLVVLAVMPTQAQQNGSSAVLTAPPFEIYLDLLRQQAGIPGMSAAILQDGVVVWERGLGFQNQEARIRATPDTPYPVGDLSATVASALLLQCVEQRRLELDEPVRRYGVALTEENATLRQILNHTSAGTPGETFKYDPDRFALLAGAVEFCAPQPYRKSVAHRVLERLAMKDSVPGRDLQNPNVVPEGLFDPTSLERYASVLSRLAVPYQVDRRGRAVPTELPAPEGIDGSRGLVSTVRDLAQFDAALDSGILLQPDTLRMAWTAGTGKDRLPLPTGLGWFVQSYNGEPVVWHFGLMPNAYSSLIIKLPARHVTLILLANSDALSAPYQLALGDVTRSVFATLFLRLFTLGP